MRAVVVGFGRMGGFHARVLTDLGYTVTTVDPAGHADYKTIPHHDWTVAAVATPAATLAAYTTRFLLSGTPVLVEKPAATNTHSVRRLAATQAKTGTRCAVGFVERFNPRVIELKQTLGPTSTATFTRINDRPSWNPALDLMLHDIDLALHLGLDPAHCTFHTALGPRKIRRINTPTTTVDLTAHTTSPLHALWTAFTTNADYPTLTDALAAHQVLDQHHLTAAA